MAKDTLSITDFSNEEISGLGAEFERAGIPFKKTNYVELDASGGQWPALLVQLAPSAATIGAVAHAFASYFKHRKRKITFNCVTGEESLEGYSAEDVLKILKARNDGRIEIGERKPRERENS